MNDMQELVNIAGMTAYAIESGKLVWVVRCKDCRYAEQTMFDDEYCCYYDEENESGCKRLHKGNFFCADGKKR